MADTLQSLMAEARSVAREVPPAEANDALDGGGVQLLLDVRERQEFSDGHLPGAVNIPRGMLEMRADPASPGADPTLSAAQSGRILVYCAKNPGARSFLAARTLARMGFENVEVLGGGLASWEEAGLPVERG